MTIYSVNTPASYPDFNTYYYPNKEEAISAARTFAQEADEEGYEELFTVTRHDRVPHTTRQDVCNLLSGVGWAPQSATVFTAEATGDGVIYTRF